MFYEYQATSNVNLLEEGFVKKKHLLYFNFYQPLPYKGTNY